MLWPQVAHIGNIVRPTPSPSGDFIDTQSTETPNILPVIAFCMTGVSFKTYIEVGVI